MTYWHPQFKIGDIVLMDILEGNPARYEGRKEKAIIRDTWNDGLQSIGYYHVEVDGHLIKFVYETNLHSLNCSIGKSYERR